MANKLSLARFLAIVGLTSACTVDPAHFEPRPSELVGQSWADQTSRYVWAVLPEPPRWKKDISPDKIQGTAVVVSDGHFLAACALIEDENAVGLARVNKYYIASLVRRIDDGSCLLAAPDAPVNLPSWRRVKPPSANAEPVILVSMTGVRDIHARTATLLGGTFRGATLGPAKPAIAFDRFGAIIGLAVSTDEGTRQLIGNQALRFADLARLEPEAPIRDDRPDTEFSVVATPEFAAPELRPTTIALSAEPERQDDDDRSARGSQPNPSDARSSAQQATASQASDGGIERDEGRASEAKSSTSGKSKGAKNRDGRERAARNKDRKNRDRRGRGKRDRGGKRDKDDRRDRDAKKDRDDRKGRGGRRGRGKNDDD